MEVLKGERLTQKRFHKPPLLTQMIIPANLSHAQSVWNKCPKCHSAKNSNRHSEPSSDFYLLTLKIFRTSIITPYFMLSSSEIFSYRGAVSKADD